MTPDKAQPVHVRPRKGKPASSNGSHEPEAFARAPVEPTDADMADWSRGASALARMPAQMRLRMLDALHEVRSAAQAEVDGQLTYLERLRYETEEMLASGIGAKLGARVLATVPTDPPPPLLIGRLDPTGHTILYGTGGVGKGTLASSWIVGLLNDDKRILVVDYENHPDEWARRVHGLGASELIDRVLHVAPLTAAWGGKRGAIWVQADDLRSLALDFRADYLVIDSIVPACAGSDPLKPEAVSQYAGALEYIGVPALSLAHVTKADDLRYPFGSIFWHNLSRTTWSLKADGATVVLNHRKHNNYAKAPAMKVEVTWSAEGTPQEVWERSYSEDLTRRISQVLVGQQLTVSKICELLDDEAIDDDTPAMKPDTVRKALRRGEKASPAKFVRDGEKWGNVA